MKNIKVTTFKADIYLGTKIGYDGEHISIQVVRDICQEYCDKVKAGVTITRTEFIYVDGNELGVVVGFIKYPRFPKPKHIIKDQAIRLAEKLMRELKQFRCSIVCTDETILLTNEDLQTDF